MRRPTVRIILSAALAVICAGAWTTAFAAGSAVKAPEKYTTLCASCHGPKGDGNTPTAEGLKAMVKVRDFTKGDYMNARTDAQLTKVIKEGGASSGMNALMIAFGSQLSDKEVKDILVFIRSVAKPPYKPKK
ncbi:MAG: c-type cytochrome [candidate division NC10 bacterium]|nr:c-type cytochrome [candidate division NC10 bacterium]